MSLPINRSYSNLIIFTTGIFSFITTSLVLPESEINRDDSIQARDFESKESADYFKDIDLRMANTFALDTHLSSYGNELVKQPDINAEFSAVDRKAIELVKEFEGFRSAAYLDTDGTPVIGYGLSKISGVRVKIGDVISRSKADKALKAQLEAIQKELESNVLKVELNNYQLGALTSLTFNVGINAIKRSTLVRKLNYGDYSGAANEFLRWDKATIRGRKVKLEGLSRRRRAERDFFLTNIASN